MDEPETTWWASRRHRLREANDWRFFRYFGIAYIVFPMLLLVLTTLRHTWIMLPVWLSMFVVGIWFLRESRVMRAMQANDRWRT